MTDPRRIYFAHPISDYGTAFERWLLAQLRQRFPNSEIVNPNTEEHQQGYARAGMDYFLKEVLPHCDGCVFLTFPGGKIGAGVAREVDWFYVRMLPVWEWSTDDEQPGLRRHFTPMWSIAMTREETRGASLVLKTMPNGGRK